MDAQIENIIKGDKKEAVKSLEDFVETAAQIFSFPELAKNNNRKLLWGAIFSLANSSTDEKILANCFTAVRILSREKAGLNELISEEWFELIATSSGLKDQEHDIDETNLPVAVEALKSLCNLIFNCPVAATMSCRNGILEQLVKRLRSCEQKDVPNEIKFFDVKLIFLITALCSEVRGKVKDEMGATVSLLKLLDFILKEAAEKATPDKIILDDTKVDLACEILKALFNLTVNSYGANDDQSENEQCAQLMNLLRMYLLLSTNSREKTAALQNNIINLLTNIPNSSFGSLTTPIHPDQTVGMKFQFEGRNMTAFYATLMFLNDKFNDKSGVYQQYEILSPVITVLLKSANGDRTIRKYLRAQILPPLKDVHHRPEQGTTIRNHLCRLLTTPITQLRDLVAELLFVLCKKSVNRMIKYTGYGNAAGLFAQRGLLGGQPDEGEADYSSDEDSETEEYAEHKHGINPVIGCYEEPHPNAMENMTEEQKEYEAMKLVELMDNLTRCGAIKPCRVGADGKPHPIEHVLQLREGVEEQGKDSDSE